MNLSKQTGTKIVNTQCTLSLEINWHDLKTQYINYESKMPHPNPT
jgi:hypothetical protein